MVPLSAVLITRNEEDTLGDAIESVRFCDEIVVVDSGSTDRTRDDRPREGGAGAGERALAGIRGPAQRGGGRGAHTTGCWPWTRTSGSPTDAAGRDPGAAAAGLRGRRLPHPPGGLLPGPAGSRPPTGGPTRRCACSIGGAPAGRASSCTSRCGCGGPLLRLRSEMAHYPYRNVSDHLGKIDRYTTLWARQMHASGRRVRTIDLLFAPNWAFFRNYFLKRGFRLGRAGLTDLRPQLVLHVPEAGQAGGDRARRQEACLPHEPCPARGHGAGLARRAEPGAAHRPGHGGARPRGGGGLPGRRASSWRRARAAGLRGATGALSRRPLASRGGRAGLRAAGLPSRRGAAPRPPRGLRRPPGPPAGRGGARRWWPRGGWTSPCAGWLVPGQVRGLRARDRGERGRPRGAAPGRPARGAAAPRPRGRARPRAPAGRPRGPARAGGAGGRAGRGERGRPRRPQGPRDPPARRGPRGEGRARTSASWWPARERSARRSSTCARAWGWRST